ncbi:hypothetical protein BH20VER3_BH20VER3_10400 [soil metagenome]
MKHFVLALSLAFVSPAAGQSSPAPTNTSAQAAKAQMATSEAAPSPSATVPVEPPSLIPPNILPPSGTLSEAPSAPQLEQLNTFFKQTSMGKAADEHRLHLQMSALETRIRNDEDLHALKASAQRAPTDLERRHRLRTYYKLYFKKLRALATTPELKTYLSAQEASHEIVLLQPRVRHESDAAEAAALAKIMAGTTATPLATPAQARASDTLRP